MIAVLVRPRSPRYHSDLLCRQHHGVIEDLTVISEEMAIRRMLKPCFCWDGWGYRVSPVASSWEEAA